MKLLFCPHCNTVFNLVLDQWKSCDCGRVKGKYLYDLHAVYCGGFPIGFNNYTFAPALAGQPERGLGRRFEAFVIPKQCPTMREVSPDEIQDSG